ncbi:MAG: HD domain-containing phosphohydrolase [Anaerolineales bacterium]|jgi:HD-GYP domain-containing protein (c-di-GMP phosphodiesterase class II)
MVAINLLVPFLAFVLYLVLLFVVLTYRRGAHSRAQRVFPEYLIAMMLWSLSAFVVFIGWRDLSFWFRLMLVSSLASSITLFHFVEVMLDRRWSWAGWVYFYGVLAIFAGLIPNFMVYNVSMNSGGLTYEFTPLLYLVAGPGFILYLFCLAQIIQSAATTRDPYQHNRLRYLYIGLLVVVLTSITDFTPLGKYPIDIAGSGLNALVIAYAILRHQLLDIKVVFRKSLLYSIPTVIITTAYFLIISAAEWLFPSRPGLSIFIISVIAAVMTALVFQPLRDKAQVWIDRLFFRENYNSGLMLQRLSSRVASILDLDQVTTLILDEIKSSLHIQRAAFFLRKGDSGDYSLTAQYGLETNGNVFFNSDHPIISWLSSHDLILTKTELETLPQFKALWEREREELEKLGAELFISLKAKGEVVGILTVGPKQSEEGFSPDDQQTLITLANQTAVALENARLYAQTERRMQDLTALRTIDMAITSSSDIHLTLGILLEQVIRQLHVDATDVLIFNIVTQTFRFAAGHGFYTEALKHTDLRLGDGFAGRAARDRHMITIRDLARNTGGLQRSIELAQEGFVTYIGVPLLAKGEIKGVMEIFQREALELDLEQRNFLETLAGQAAIAIDSAELFDNLQGSNAELMMAYDETIEGWSHAIDLRDEETEEHSRRVMELTIKMANQMGFGQKEMVHIRRGTLLHDVGKIGVPDNILRKTGPLSEDEWLVMRKHPQFAYDMLVPISYLKPALDIPYCHHEKWDGTGYPRKLKGEQIPLSARIFSVVDVWDALTSDRPYRKAWAENAALEYIQAQSGISFDPKVVDMFLKEVYTAEWGERVTPWME